MFREPSPCDESKNTAPTKDPCALSRSTIRRQSSVRRASRYGGHEARNSSLRTHLARHIADSHLARNILEEETATDSGRDARPSDPSGNSSRDHSINAGGDLSETQRREAARRIQARVNTDRYGTPDEFLRMSQRRLGDSTPVFGLLHTTDDSSSQRPSPERRQEQQLLPFTPRFAPAAVYHRGRNPPATRDTSSPSLSDLYGIPQFQEGREEDLSTRRRWFRRLLSGGREGRSEPVVDGLGDRQRSLSPDNENDAWDTLLTTITSDVPTEGSFVGSGSSSARAAPSDAASRLDTPRSSDASSSHALPSLDLSASATLDPYPEYLNPCDYPTSDSGSDSDSGGSRFIPGSERLRRFARRAQVGSTMGSQPPIPAIPVSFTHSTVNPELQRV